MSEKLKPNFTPIPNMILDHIMPKLSPGATKLLFAICRFTYGYGRQADRISLSQLAEATGLDRRSVSRCVKQLGGIVTVTPGSVNLASEYRLNIEISDAELGAICHQRQNAARGKGSDRSVPFQRKPKKEEDKIRSSVFSPIVENVIRRLNELAGTAYRASTKSSVSHIQARLEEGFCEADLIAVVEDRCARWLNNPEMSEYLRPSTLFNSEKFESYLRAARHANGTATRDDSEWRKETFVNG